MKKRFLLIFVLLLCLVTIRCFGLLVSYVINSGGVINYPGQSVNPFWLASAPKASGEIGLSWRFSNDPNRVGYNIYRSIASGSGYNKINSGLITTTSYVDSGLTNGQTYYYVVKAVYANETESEESNEASATATSDTSQFNRYRVIGGGAHPAFHNTLDEAGRYYSASVSVGDLDGDGMIDFVCWQKGPNARLVAFLHDGTYLWEAPFDIQGPGHNVRVVVGDIDGDGNAEVVSHDKYGGYYLRVRDGLTGALKKESGTVAPPENRANVALADLNGNGHRDAIIFHYGGDKANVRVVAFDGDLNELWTFATSHSGGHWLKIEDIDEDEKDEILLGGLDFIDDDGSRIAVDNPQPSFYGVQGHVDAIAVGDFDWSNPGLEIVFAGCAGEHVWMVNSQGKLMWDSGAIGHTHMATLGDFDPTVAGNEAFVVFGDAYPYHKRIFYADGTWKSVSVEERADPPMIDWDGDWTNGDEIFPVRTNAYNKITNVHTGAVLFNPNGQASGNRAVDVVGDYRDEFLWADCGNRRLVIFTNTDSSAFYRLTKWDDSYWRLTSKYKRSFLSEYINGALAY